MDEKLNKITEKLYNDGVVKAQEEADKILQKAQQEAKVIIEEANRQSNEILARANKDNLDLKHKVEAELKLAGEQVLASIKQKLVNLISDKISSKISTEAFNDNEFVEKLILTVAEKWKNEEGIYDLNIILSEDLKNLTESFFSSKGKELLDAGVVINFENIESKGFVLSPYNGGYQINFTDEVFMNFFSDYLRGYTKQLLFEN